MPSQFVEEAYAASQQEEEAKRAAILNAQTRAYQRAQVEQAQRGVDASISPPLQRECGLEALQGARYGSAAGIAQHNPQKTFTRAEVLTIIKAEHARLCGMFPAATEEDNILREGGKRLSSSLALIFERME